jgi:hypothetical protein
MKLEAGRYYTTKGGHLVGPLEDFPLDDWPWNCYIDKLDCYLWFNKKGWAEGEMIGERYPTYDLILNPIDEVLKVEDFV